MEERPTLTQINKISGKNDDFRERLINILKTELVSEVSTYQKNLSLGKYIECAENVHKLKHKIGILGLEKSYEVAVLFEEDLKKSNLKNKKAFDDILKSMLEFTAQL
ncbi:Hpt domain-containing protein [Zunongwangia sp. F363]|uniref:Hpt domain-containing protein n=1 Tax=Autumnicola tepida TaxID=3075595 RepID=A0ABU3CF00_9FLAO|nr:Hpt domain-containing protein [Zunongwangia sp. F363]MDT0644932.1 Hpt domain-containing protein [Zunongwangia sp. F363]